MFTLSALATRRTTPAVQPLGKISAPAFSFEHHWPCVKWTEAMKLSAAFAIPFIAVAVMFYEMMNASLDHIEENLDKRFSRIVRRYFRYPGRRAEH